MRQERPFRRGFERLIEPGPKIAVGEPGAQREGNDRFLTEVAGGHPQDQALLVGRQRGGGEVRRGGLLDSQVPSVGEEVKRGLAARPR